MLYASAINKHLQKYSRTQNLQNNNKLNCKSKCIIYLTERRLCNKENKGKSENLRLNKAKIAPSWLVLLITSSQVQKHLKLTLNEQNVDKELLKYRLRKWKDSWIKKLKTLQSHALNAEMNSRFPNISVFLVRLFLRKSYTKGISKRHPV